jgi:3-hydroxyisobutyrate dehydrogenase
MARAVGYIGLGIIGKPLASHLAPAGFETCVYDLLDEPVRELVAGGAVAAGSPRELAERCEIVGICVPADEHVRAVLRGEDGVLAGAAPGTVVAVHSTVLPDSVVELAEEAAAREVVLIDAPVTGGDKRAEEGVVTYLVGGDPGVLERIRPYLEASSETILHAGELGDGLRLKLALNVLSYIQWAAAHEAFLLARALGLPAELFEEAGRANGQLTELQARYLISQKLPDEIAHGEALQGWLRSQMDTAEKDLGMALQLARDHGISLPVSGLVSQQMARIYRVVDPGRR